MAKQWRKRRAHSRQLKSGRTVPVRESQVLCEIKGEKNQRKSASYRHSCPMCGAEIVSVRMPNGGWGHFEGAKGLGSVKHPCFSRGSGLPRSRDPDTPDMFENYKAEDEDTVG